MGKLTAALLCLVVALIALPADARIKRSHVPIHAFVKANACPSTGVHRLPCPGWQVDHVQALCAGGFDTRENMQWLTIEEHRIKTRTDVRVCRYLRKIPKD